MLVYIKLEWCAYSSKTRKLQVNLAWYEEFRGRFGFFIEVVYC